MQNKNDMIEKPIQVIGLNDSSGQSYAGSDVSLFLYSELPAISSHVLFNMQNEESSLFFILSYAVCIKTLQKNK